MNNKKSTKRALLSSVLSLLLCLTMLIGTTFAWFTDTATSKNNKIVAGTLDVQLLMHDGSDYKDISNTEASIFGNADSVIAQNDNTNTLWEPGKTQVAYLAIKNNGNLDLKYQVTLQVRNPEGGKDLYKAMEYVITPDAKNNSITAWDGTNAETPMLGTQVVSNGEGYLQDGETHYFALSVHMKEEAGNEYQGGQIDFDLSVVATQLNSESDSFGPEYDVNAEYPVWLGETDTDWEGTGTETDPYQISSVEELAGLAQAVNGTTLARSTTEPNSFAGKYFILTSDIDLESMNWAPIGSSTTKFEGNFDGQDHTISNLVSAKTGASNMGLFGFTQSGMIKNFTINNAIVEGRLNIGVVAGSPYTTKYDNIKLTGDIKVNGMSYVGGAFGKNAYTDITNITIEANEGSYVKANSVENGTAYRTYVGGVVGFMGEGGHKVENVTSNIDVIGSTCDVGGITGIAHYGNNFINCSSSGDVTITDLSEDKADYLEIGGIAGVWHNQTGQTVTFTGCSYTGTLSTPEEVEVANGGLVGKAYNTTGKGILNIDGNEYMSFGGEDYVAAKDADELATALANGDDVVMTSDVDAGGQVFVNNGGVLDGNGKTLTVSSGDAAYESGLTVTEGTVKNVTVAGAFRGLGVGGSGASEMTGDVTYENVTVTGATYGVNIGIGNGHKLTMINCTLPDWNSYSGLSGAQFTGCTFTSEGRWYAAQRISANATFTYTDCDFTQNTYDNADGEEKYYLDSYGNGTIVFENCRMDGVLITEENLLEHFQIDPDNNTTVKVK